MQDNIISINTGVSTLVYCRQLCHDEPACAFLTYYGPDSFPFSDNCILYSSCEGLYPCENCFTEESSCLPVDFQVCSSSLESHLGDNMLQFITNVEDEANCKSKCSGVDDCTFYTYHNLSDPGIPGGCFLLSNLDLGVPLKSCPHCKTGPLDCTKR